MPDADDRNARWRNEWERLHVLDLYARGNVRVFAVVEEPSPAIVERVARHRAEGRKYTTYSTETRWYALDGDRDLGPARASCCDERAAGPVRAIEWAVLVIDGTREAVTDERTMLRTVRIAQDTAESVEEAKLAAESAARDLGAALATIGWVS